MTFNPFDLVMTGVGEVIQPDDPRHPKYQAPSPPEFTPLETTTEPPPEDK